MVSVLVEEKVDISTGCHRGFSRNYLPVTLFGGGAPNHEVAVRLERLENDRLLGHVIAEAATAPGFTAVAQLPFSNECDELM